mmetsp:Transcript_23933/g.73285  ORF Transcript_23933/g.73285 Transcript_23933/m.73285 type:complete len:312 (-) Transcript_23933:494-1429(-)
MARPSRTLTKSLNAIRMSEPIGAARHTAAGNEAAENAPFIHATKASLESPSLLTHEARRVYPSAISANAVHGRSINTVRSPPGCRTRGCSRSEDPAPCTWWWLALALVKKSVFVPEPLFALSARAAACCSSTRAKRAKSARKTSASLRLVQIAADARRRARALARPDLAVRLSTSRGRASKGAEMAPSRRNAATDPKMCVARSAAWQARDTFHASESEPKPAVRGTIANVMAWLTNRNANISASIMWSNAACCNTDEHRPSEEPHNCVWRRHANAASKESMGSSRSALLLMQTDPPKTEPRGNSGISKTGW